MFVYRQNSWKMVCSAGQLLLSNGHSYQDMQSETKFHQYYFASIMLIFLPLQLKQTNQLNSSVCIWVVETRLLTSRRVTLSTSYLSLPGVLFGSSINLLSFLMFPLLHLGNVKDSLSLFLNINQTNQNSQCIFKFVSRTICMP